MDFFTSVLLANKKRRLPTRPDWPSLFEKAYMLRSSNIPDIMLEFSVN